jgi:hypothetical protein
MTGLEGGATLHFMIREGFTEKSTSALKNQWQECVSERKEAKDCMQGSG